MRLAGGHLLTEAVVGVAQLAINERAVEKLNRHAEIRIARPFAGTDRLPFRLPEHLEEVMFRDVGRRERRRLRAARQTGERLRQIGHRTNGVEQLFG